MNFSSVLRRAVACGVSLTMGTALARGEPTPSPTPVPVAEVAVPVHPLLHEVWVPTVDLDPVLARYPRAVPLDRDQLLTLLRDAADPAAADPALAPPEGAVLRHARFDGRLATGPDARPQVRVEAELEIDALSDAWADVPLGLPDVALGTIGFDGPVGAAAGRVDLLRYGTTPGNAVGVRFQGRGVHRVRLGFVLPVDTGADDSSVSLPWVDGVGEFFLHLPAGARADSSLGCAVEPEGAGVVARVVLPHAIRGPGSDPISPREFVEHARWTVPPTVPGPAAPRLSWRTVPPATPGAGVVRQINRMEVTVEASRVAVQQTITLQPALGRLPGEARFALPTGAGAVRVERAPGRWDVGADGVSVALPPEAVGGAAEFTVFYDLPLTLDPGGGISRVGLSLLEVVGAHRVEGSLGVLRGRGVQVRRIEPGTVATPSVADSRASAPDFVAGFTLADLPLAPGPAAPPPALTLEARRTTARFRVDADAHADIRPDGVQIQRTLTLHVEEGEVFAARVRLPHGETLLALKAAAGYTAPEWRQESDDLFLTWNTGLPETASVSLTLDTRANLVPPKADVPSNFSFGALLVPGAKRLEGYVALTSAPGLRTVATGGEDRLERRDGRAIGRLGDAVWFYRDDFHLSLRVERRAAETEARFTGYALPLAGAVEIHAQIGFRFLFSGVETVRVRVPSGSAEAFFFTGEHIAERRRDGDVWTIRFQDEQRGDYTLAVQATIPAPADKDDAQRFHFRLPAIVPLESARWSGAWAVEANTDTEIRFTTTGANEVDTLDTPVVAGYLPRRRVIGVFEFLGGAVDAAVNLDGVRHPAAAVAAAVVDRLDLETFATTSGVSRHRATLLARMAGDGFFNLRLPDGASLWSLTRDGEPVKPVGGAVDELRVELPGGRAPGSASTVVAVYETPGTAWTGAGARRVDAPGFDPGVPVLESHWKLHLPDGFDYRFSGSLPGAVSSEAPAPGDLLIPRIARAFSNTAQWIFHLPQHLEAGKVQSATPGITDTDIDTGPVLAAQMQIETAASPDTGAIERKLSTIIVPNIAFRSTTLGDAIEVLRQESRRLDIDPDPAKRGVNIFLKLPAKPAPSSVVTPDASIPGLPTNADANVPAVTASADTRITLTLSRIPLLEAIKYVASQAALKVWVEPYAVSIVPISEQTDVMVTAYLNVPPSFLGLAASASTTRVDARSALEASGVTFPPGASATYLPARKKLVVRDTQENIDLIKALVAENQTVDRPSVRGSGKVIITRGAKDDGSMVTAEVDVGRDVMSGMSSAGARAGGRDNTGTGTVTIARQDARSFLEANGVVFPPGASATYLPGTGKLVLRNTRANIARAAAVSGALLGPAAPGADNAYVNSQFAFPGGQKGEDRVAGLLPLRLDLPVNGQTYEFADGGEPGTLDFHFTDWRTAARGRWIALTLGALGFLLFASAWARPWRRTAWVALALTFFPLIVAPSATVTCNALLAGWLWAVLGWCVTRFLLRHRRMAIMTLLCIAALLPSLARAEPTPTPAPELVIVPYDASKPPAGQRPSRYYLPYERFLTLWDAAKRHRNPPAPDAGRYGLNSARYDVRLNGETLEIEATFDLDTRGKGWVNVPFSFKGVQVGSLTVDDASAVLSEYSLLRIETPGAHRVRASLRLAAGAATEGTALTWTVPPAMATLVTLLLPRTDLRAEIHGDAPGGGAVEETTPEGRRLAASIGHSKTVALNFRHAPPPAPAAGQPSLAHVDARLVAGPRQETIHAEVNLAFPGGTQDHFTVQLDRSLTLTGLDAPDIKEWRLDTGGELQILDITLNSPARDAYRLGVEADRPIFRLPAGHRTFPVVSATAGRVEQTVALRMDGDVEITLPDGPPANARRVEDTSKAEGRPFAAFAGNGTPSLVYSVRATTGKRVAHIDYFYQVSRGKIELAASARLVPAAGGAPLLTADLRIPAGLAVQAVAGDAVREWWHEGNVLSLRFRPEDARGERLFVVDLVQPWDQKSNAFALPPLVAQGFTETDGQVIVAADRSYKVSLTLPGDTRARDLGEIDPAAAAPEFQVAAPLERQRAFRYRGAEYEASATLEGQPARWQAQWVTRGTVREGVLGWETHVNVQARQGAVDALEFSLPAGLAEARVNGVDVRETVTVSGGDARRHIYRVIFQNPVYAERESDFTVSLELTLGGDGAAAVPDLLIPDAGGRAAGGFLLVENASSGEMTLDPHGLDPSIEKDVPFLPAQIVAGTRFFRAAPGLPWSLGVRVTDLEKTAGRAALVAYAELTSTLRADGEEWHRVVYRLQNRRLQYLPVELPPGTEFIGARVAGESVRVDAGPGGKDAPSLLVPLLKTRPGELSYDVELVYLRPPSGSGTRGLPFFDHWQLEDPRLPGVPVEKTLWNVFLPPGASLLDSGGNVEPIVAALGETEKLESAVSDLRSLAATYGSAAASEQERQLALSNFNALAVSVTRGANVRSTGREGEENEQMQRFDQRKLAGQSAAVSRKQESIRRELDSLNSANSRTRQMLTLQGANTYTGNTTLTAGTLSVNGGIQAWRDNRGIDQQKEAGASQTFSGALTQAPPRKAQLSLNDSLAVDLPGTGMISDRDTSARLEAVDSSRIAATAAPAAPAPALADKNVDTSMPPEVAKPRTESLRSVGRISLAVEFPHDGPVYHFKKIKADARLTLWSTRPERFVRLEWLGVLLVILAAAWMIRRAVQPRMRGRSAAIPATNF